ncbi:hypothetical protein OE903_10070 [Bacillus sp. B6(2022)]|nr:hypothetical protein [Bacillus sp. B6(2022)]
MTRPHTDHARAMAMFAGIVPFGNLGMFISGLLASLVQAAPKEYSNNRQHNQDQHNPIAKRRQ